VRNRFSHGRKAFDLNQGHCIVKFVGRAIGEPHGCTAVDFCVGDDAVERVLVRKGEVALVDVFW
jgi:hypothetical protein